MNYFLDLLSRFKEHWNTIALAATWLGIAFVWWKRRTHWLRKQFLNQVNFSLNYVVDNAPAMRTLHETTAQLVWLNEYGVQKVFAAAQKTTVENPFIVLADPDDQEFINRAVLNTLSERFAESYVAAALGLPVRHGKFMFALTCEKYGEIRTLKLRVLIIEEQLLNQLFGPDGTADKLQLPAQIYAARLKTLRLMHGMYMKDRQTQRPTLGHMEMGLPCA